ncbi:hypothetical protein ABNC55_21305 [Paenibacillus larvae]
MSDKTVVSRSDLVMLLDKEKEFEKDIFEHFSGVEYSESKETLNTVGIKKIFETLIPTVTWTKEDFIKKSKEISITGTEKEETDSTQLIISLDGVENTFITTSDASDQLFTPIRMTQYANFLIKDPDHFSLLLSNFEYWFKIKKPDDEILVRTVIEDGKRIIRCFATPLYRPIDNHVLLYIALWALEKLKVKFRLSLSRIDHSSMKLDFVSEENKNLEGIGTLGYGFTVVNSESKEKTASFYPTFELTNIDGTSATLIMDKPISIVHRGKHSKSILNKLKEIHNIHKHVDWVIQVIKIAQKSKIDDTFAFKVQREIIKVIGNPKFERNFTKFTKISSNNTLNLLQFFGRLSELDVCDEEQEIKIKTMFWKLLRDETKVSNPHE